MVQHAQAVFAPDATLEGAMPSLTDGFALLVVDDDRPVGILTKIDVLDYVAGKL